MSTLYRATDIMRKAQAVMRYAFGVLRWRTAEYVARHSNTDAPVGLDGIRAIIADHTPNHGEEWIHHALVAWRTLTEMYATHGSAVRSEFDRIVREDMPKMFLALLASVPPPADRKWQRGDDGVWRCVHLGLSLSVEHRRPHSRWEAEDRGLRVGGDMVVGVAEAKLAATDFAVVRRRGK